jgi:ADP-heptose:LPS heptosyltransferase
MLGLDPAPAPVVWTAPEDRARVDDLVPDGPVIVLAPTANWAGKVWPPDRFVALFRALQTHLPGAVPVVLGGAGSYERDLARPVLEGLPEAVNLVGRLDLSEVAALMGRCKLFVGNDSGLMHIAAAAGAPTLGLFGPTLEHGEKYLPRGPRTAVARAADGRMSSIAVADVLRYALSLLHQPVLS